MTQTQTYFSQEFINFFIELSKNNHKDWFEANRKRYIQFVKDPFYKFIEDTIDVLSKKDKSLKMDAKNAIFRINKDVRFSKDKAPYKLHVAALINGTYKKDFQNPNGIYIQLSAEGVWLGGGNYMPGKEELIQIRNHIAANPKKIESILADKEFKKIYGGFATSELSKIIPKELKSAAEKLPYIYNKQFYYSATYDEKQLLKKDLVSFILKHYEIATPLTKFLIEATK